MKKSNLILSTVMASLALAGCSSMGGSDHKYVVVEDRYMPPPTVQMVAPQPVMVQEPVAPVQVNACCNDSALDSAPKSETMVEQPEMVKEVHYVEKTKPKKSELLKITGIGYGAESTYQAYTAGQRRLMAIRSSKLDAYRSLAEQIYGIKIDSNTSVATLTAKNDSFRARVNAVVRGARLVSVTPMADNNYETVLEVYVDKEFFEKAFVYTGDEEEVAIEPEAMYRFRTLR